MIYDNEELEYFHQLHLSNDKNKNPEVAEKTFQVINYLHCFFEQLMIYISGYEAYQQLLSEGYAFNLDFEAFGLLSVEAIEIAGQQELTRVFDKGKTCGKENCSLETLKEVLLSKENKLNFPLGEEDELIVSINKLYELYDLAYSKEVRNTRIGHHDLKTLIDSKPVDIDFLAIRTCVTISRLVISDIRKRIYGFAPSLQEYQEAVDIYKRQLMLVMHK